MFIFNLLKVLGPSIMLLNSKKIKLTKSKIKKSKRRKMSKSIEARNEILIQDKIALLKGQKF